MQTEWQESPISEWMKKPPSEKPVCFKLEPSTEEPGGIILHLNFEAAKVFSTVIGTTLDSQIRRQILRHTSAFQRRLECMKIRISGED